MDEIIEWRTIPGFPLYEASSEGGIRHARYKRSLKPHTVGVTGYLGVHLYAGGLHRGPRTKRPFCLVHRLVCLAFHGDPPTPEHEVAHGDGVKANCRKSNLRWATRKDNHADMKVHGTNRIGQRNGRAKLTNEQVFAIRTDPRIHQEVADAYGVSYDTIQRICAGTGWKHLHETA